jgi:soluble lytic murein transglycosylase-like protein
VENHLACLGSAADLVGGTTSAARPFAAACFLLFTAIVAAAQDKPADAIRKQLAAAQIQREAVRKQAELAAQYRISPPIEAQSDCDPLPPAEITPIVDAAAQGHQVQTALLRGVMEQESGGRPCAVSSKGARGLMQLMPATIEQFHVDDPFDPKQNIEAGAQFLKQLLDKYKGDLSLALAAYNAGPAAVDQANGIPEIKETRDYVDAILKKLKTETPKPPVPPN